MTPGVDVVGISHPGTCGVRDHAAGLGAALEASGWTVRNRWVEAQDRGLRACARAALTLLRAAGDGCERDAVLWHYASFSHAYRGVPLLGVLCGLVGRRRGRRVVTVLHELWLPWLTGTPRHDVLALLQLLAIGLVLLGSDAVVVTTEQRAAVLRRLPPPLRRPVHVVPVHSTVGQADGVGVPPEGPLVIPAWGDAAVRPEDALPALAGVGQILLLGGPGPESAAGERWVAAARAAGVEDRVRFSGVVPSAGYAAWLRRAGLVVLLNPEGPSSRKTSLAAALGNGAAVLSLDGPNRWTAPIAAGAVRVCTSAELARAAAADLADVDGRRARGAAATAFYRQEMAVERAATTVANALERRNGLVDARPSVTIVAHEVHDRGGMERALAEQIRQLHESFDLTVVSARLQDDLRAFVRWRRVACPSRPAPARFVCFWLCAGWRLRGCETDLVHTLGAIAPGRVDVVTVAYCHAGARLKLGRLAPGSAAPARRLNTTVSRRLALAAERRVFPVARLLAPVSPGVNREVSSFYPTPTATVPNGVDARRFRPDPEARAAVRAALRVDPADPVAVFVGGEWHGKGLGYAIDGIARARDLTGAAPRLWVVGSGDEPRFAAQARRLGLEDRVRFLGRRTDVERYLAAADVFLFPTAYETFSLVAYEAAAAGLPVIATRVSGIEDLVGEDESAGRFVQRQADSVGAALVELLGDASLRQRLGACGRERTSRYTWEESAEQLRRAYQSLLTAPRGPATPTRQKRLRAVLLSPTAVLGGAESVFRGLLHHADDVGICALPVVLGAGPLVDALRADGYEVVVLPHPRLRDPAGCRRLHRQLRALLRRERPDVLYSNLPKGHVYAALAARAEHVPVVWCQANVPTRPSAIDRVASALPAAAVVCPSRSAAQAQSRLGRVRPVVVSPGVDTARFRPHDAERLRGEFGLADGQPWVGVVGRLQEWKNQDKVLRAFSTVVSEFPDARLAVVGGALLGWEGDYPARLRGLADGLGIAGQVDFVGNRDDVGAWMSALDVVVNASDPEPFGLVVIEALACGTPVVAVASGGPAEIMRHGEHGLLVGAPTPSELSDAIRTLLSDTPLRGAMGAAGRRLVEERYTERRTAELYESVLRAAAEGRGRR